MDGDGVSPGLQFPFDRDVGHKKAPMAGGPRGLDHKIEIEAAMTTY